MTTYRYSQKLGRGGMAEVFLALQEGIGGFEKLVVVKRIFPHLCDDERFVQMFLDEARLAASIRHPNVVEIIDIGQDEGGYFIVMEYLRGETLGFLLEHIERRGERLPVELACAIGAAVAAGLHEAHTATDVTGEPTPIVHRDVTPSNVVVCFNGVTKLVDFGIAKAVTRQVETRVAGVKGKLPYLAPEQIRDQRVDARTDLFQLGVVMHEMLTGRRLFRAATDHQIMAAVLGRRIPAPSELNPEVPPALDELVLHTLAREPSRRVESADEVHHRLDEVAHALGVRSATRALGAWIRSACAEALARRRAFERRSAVHMRKSRRITVPALPALEVGTGTPLPSAVATPSTGSLASAVAIPSTGSLPLVVATPSTGSLPPGPAAEPSEETTRPLSRLAEPEPKPRSHPHPLAAVAPPPVPARPRRWLGVVYFGGMIALGATVAGWIFLHPAAEVAPLAASAPTTAPARSTSGSARAASGLPRPPVESARPRGLGPQAGRPSTPPPISPAPATAVVEPEPAATDTFLVQVRAVPATARLFLDDGAARTGALSIRLPRDGVEHRLVITADEYEPRVVSFTDTPLATTIELEPLRARRRSSRRSRSRRARAERELTTTPAQPAPVQGTPARDAVDGADERGEGEAAATTRTAPILGVPGPGHDGGPSPVPDAASAPDQTRARDPGANAEPESAPRRSSDDPEPNRPRT
ncbi:protein kinase domain-containing protein [Haliangium sp.]|uniref:serine/threonine-protein kinase n=1 Tax=Haliangium sp. TaxID=2663208 RepID=UPI003D0A6940